MTKNIIIYSFALLGLMLLNACSDSEPSLDYASLEVVTGLSLMDANGQSVGLWREPNQSTQNVSIYPIPNNGNVFLFSGEIISKVWIIPASCIQDSVNMDITTLSLSLAYDEEDLAEVSVQEIDVEDFTGNLALNMSTQDPGFYKIFYRMSNNEIGWTNSYTDPSQTSFPDIDFLDALCP